MKRQIAAVAAAVTVLLSPTAMAVSTPFLTIDGTDAGSDAMASIINGTTYVSLRSISTSLDDSCEISWENNTAKVQTEDFTLTARPGDTYITLDGTRINITPEVKNTDGCVTVPLRPLVQIFNAAAYWNPLTKNVAVVSQFSEDYSEDDLYWLSRIISAESQGEPLEGKIAVGNVVLNRVKSSEFPNTIYGVIFDDRWGGQFEPVRNGTIYQTPTEESILAAKLCLEGANVIGDGLYFLAPALAHNFWTVENCEYITTIGCHDFYR